MLLETRHVRVALVLDHTLVCTTLLSCLSLLLSFTLLLNEF